MFPTFNHTPRKHTTPNKKMVRHDMGVNAAFLQDVKDDDRQVPSIMAMVMAILEPPGQTGSLSAELLPLLRRLYGAVKYRFEMEEALGYMEDAVNVAPRLCRKAELLLDQHQSLLDDLQQIVELAHLRLRDTDRSKPGLASVRDPFAIFLDRFSAHEADENDLIVDSLYFDIGGGD